MNERKAFKRGDGVWMRLAGISRPVSGKVVRIHEVDSHGHGQAYAEVAMISGYTKEVPVSGLHSSLKEAEKAMAGKGGTKHAV